MVACQARCASNKSRLEFERFIEPIPRIVAPQTKPGYPPSRTWQLKQGILSTSSTAVVRDTAPQTAEQRLAESTAKNLEQRAAASTTADCRTGANDGKDNDHSTGRDLFH